jgi:hypothetical protein
MPILRDSPIYDALALPSEALANGGVEILRAGVIDNDELYVAARHAFKDPAQWGEVLAEITRRLGLLYSMETDLTEAEAIAEIEEAYAAALGAPVIEDKPRKVRAKAAAPKPASKPKRTGPKRAAAPATLRSKRTMRTKR